MNKGYSVRIGLSLAAVVVLVTAIRAAAATKTLDVLGTTRLRGIIINPAKVMGVAQPVIIADDLRVDGAIFRGAVVGSGDNKPVKINDDLSVTGTITGSVAYSNTASGVSATTVQGALDEIGVQLSKAVSGLSMQAASTGIHATSVSATTWSGTITDVCNNTLRTTNITSVVFTPTTETTGTWVSAPYNVFNAGGVCGVDPTGTYHGSYKVVDDYFLIYDTILPDGSATGVGYTASVDVRGNNMTLTDTRTSPQTVTQLTRQ